MRGRRAAKTLTGILLALALGGISSLSAQEPSDPRASALLAYSAAVRTHVQSDPVLAATYIAFWNALRASQERGDSPEAPGGERMAAIAGSINTIAGALQERYRQAGTSQPFAEVLGATVSVIADRYRAGAGPGAPAPGIAPLPPESLLGSLDQVIAPRVLVNGRYEYADGLLADAELGVSAEVWLQCRLSPECIAVHDTLFADAMGGVSLAAEEPERVARDRSLVPLISAPLVEDAVRRLAKTFDQPPADRRAAALEIARDYWQDIARHVDTRSIAPASAGAPGGPDSAEIDLLFELGRSAAYMAGAERLASSFTVMRRPLIEFSRLRAQGSAASGLLAATTGVGLLFAGIQALALLDTTDGGVAPAGTAPPALDQLVRDLHQSNYRQFIGLRTETVLTANAIDTRIAGLGVTLEVIRDDVARIETAQRARVRADFLAEDARRWAAFEADNDRCFSLRNRDARSGRLRIAEFRRCEERFLQGATRRAQYATRANDFTLDARYLTPLDARFPFHAHYPLLLTFAGMDVGTALALVDPFEWQQHAAALLRLYQANPATSAQYAPRAEVLRSLRSAGERAHAALRELTVGQEPQGFRLALHEQALDEYFNAIEEMIRRIRALDDPDADRYGKRLTVDLSQPLPEDRRLAVIETLIGTGGGEVSGLAVCPDAADEEFTAPAGTLNAASRRFFGAPVTAEELAAAWNRERVTDLDLRPLQFSALVPRPLLWASLDGLGRVDICLARLRPEDVEFTRSRAPLRGHRRGSTRLSARLEVRFTPAPAAAEALSLAPGAPVTVASYEGERSCSFSYRNDSEGCSRAACLLQLTPEMWSADSETSINGGRCTGDPLSAQLTRGNQLEGQPVLTGLMSRMETLYWQGRAARSARLQADIVRSIEFDNATAIYLRNYALAAVALGTWADASEPLAPLFAGGGQLAPRDIVTMLVSERRDIDTLFAGLEEKRRVVRQRIAAHGNQLGEQLAQGPAVDRLGHLRGLREILARIDLLLAAYESPAN